GAVAQVLAHRLGQGAHAAAQDLQAPDPVSDACSADDGRDRRADAARHTEATAVTALDQHLDEEASRKEAALYRQRCARRGSGLSTPTDVGARGEAQSRSQAAGRASSR